MRAALLLLVLPGYVLVLGSILFLAAGRIDLPMFWAWIAVFGLALLVTMAGIDPGLVRERVSPGAGGRDATAPRSIGALLVAHLVLAGLDVGRVHWSDVVPLGMQCAALTVMAGGLGLTVWAVLANRFFSSVIRVQADRGHRIVTRGPYAFVRHPGYAGALFFLPASAVALGSWLALLPMTIAVGVVVRRVVMEDRFLCAELDGYAAYARRVPARLVPGVW